MRGAVPVGSSDADLARRREQIRRGLTQSNLATAVVLLVSVGLALAAAFYGFQASRASDRTRVELWNSQLARAMALRLSGKVGRRRESLEAIAQAVRLRPSAELRDEAIATLALIDLEPGSLWRPMPAGVTTVGCSRDLKRYALGDGTGAVEVYEVAEPERLAAFNVGNRPVVSLDFSPDARHLAVRCQDGALRVWGVEEGREVFAGQYPMGGFNEHSVTFDPRGGWLVAASAEGRVEVIEVGTWRVGEPIETGGRLSSQCFDAEGTRLAVAVDQRIQIWDFARRRSLEVIEVGGAMTDLAWHCGGQILAAAHSDGNVTLLDRRFGRRMTLRAHTMPVTHVMFDPGGEVLVSTSWDGTSRFWDARSGRPLLTTQAGYAAAFEQTGERIFYYKERLGVGDWKFSRACGYASLAVPVGVSDRVLGVDFSPDGEWLCGTTGEGVHWWDLRSGEHAGFVALPDAQRAAFCSDGSALVVSSGAGLHILRFRVDAETRVVVPGAMTRLTEGAGRAFWLGFPTRGAGDWFATAAPSEVAVISLRDPSSVRSIPWAGPRRSAAVSPDGRLVAASAWKGGGTRVWDVREGREVMELKDEGGLVEFSTDGKRLVVGASTEFLVYRVATWERERVVEREVASALSGIAAFSPEGSLLAVTHTVRQARLLSADGTAVLATLDAPLAERITDLCFSWDGSRLAAATDNRVIQIWDLRRLRSELAVLGLDWEAGPGTISSVGTAAGAAGSLVGRSGPWWIAGVGTTLALLFAFYSVAHHRRLVCSYEEVEGLAEKRRSELEAARAQLIHSQKMKALGTLAAGIAHDFNNLLSIIRMASQLVARQVKPDGATKENLEAIEHAVAQGKEIVRSVLGFSRHPAQPGTVYSVNQAVSETLAMLNKQFLGGITLTLELDPNTPRICGDRTRLEQALLNLIVNAAEAMQGRGRLRIQARPAGEPGTGPLVARRAAVYAEVAVEDSGPGIPSEVLPRVFEPFFTTKHTGAERGTGLGLTTVYNIAQQEGWGLRVDTRLGSGTEFRLWLPTDGGD